MAAGAVGLAVEQLDLRAEHGKRRAQLVGGVGDEVALARERSFEPLQHVVECLAQDLHLATTCARAGAHREIACSTAAATLVIRRSGAAISVASPVPTATASISASRPATTNVRLRLDFACSTEVNGSARRSVPMRCPAR